ncbi:hypothetical protein KY337_05230 [Candidatus Woesearchaeota archaeon]|nr:hypothetical protein [Candidatus Woesearchaeota archaeon]
MVTLKQIGLTLGILAAAAALPAEPIRLARSPVKARSSFSKVYNTEETIESLMKKSVEQILEGTGVKMYTHSSKSLKELDANVYGSKKPSLVLFYTADFSQKYADTSQRSAIIFKHLASDYGDRVDFHAYRADWIDTRQGNPYLRLKAHYKPKGFGILGPPSIAMFSPFDVTKGETPYKNDGNVKMVDVLRGGPTKDKQIPKWCEILDKSWLGTNLESSKNCYVKRFQNSSKFKKIEYFGD